MDPEDSGGRIALSTLYELRQRASAEIRNQNRVRSAIEAAVSRRGQLWSGAALPAVMKIRSAS